MREEIRKRLENVRECLEKGFEISPEGKSKILKTRARELAREVGKKESADTHLEVIEFSLAKERYALELEFIREIYPLKEFTHLPCTPDFVLGIVNVRGQILSIIDLKKIFALQDKGFTDMNRIIILRSDDKEFGVIADEILGVQSVPTSDVQSSLPTLSDTQDRYLRGVTGDRLVILDGGKILSDPNIVVHEEMEG